MKRATTSYKLAQVYRLAYAKEIFNHKKISKWVDQRAADGFCHLRLYQDSPFDLDDTEPAKSLQDWLQTNGYQYQWLPAFEPNDPLRPHFLIEYKELMVMWS